MSVTLIVLFKIRRKNMEKVICSRNMIVKMSAKREVEGSMKYRKALDGRTVYY